jgi:exoribonuclease R
MRAHHCIKKLSSSDLPLAMRGQREIRGAMDFDTQETQIVFAEDRKIDKIIPVQRNDAHKLIEEFMHMQTDFT